MRIVNLTSILAILACALAVPSVASAAPEDWDIQSFSGLVANQNGTTYSQAGGHPYTVVTDFTFGPSMNDGQFRDALVDLPPGLLGNPVSTPTRCSTQLLQPPDDGNLSYDCPNSSQVGLIEPYLEFFPGFSFHLPPGPLYNMERPVGAPADLAFSVAGTAVHLVPNLRTGDFGITVGSTETSQVLKLSGATVTIWGNPKDPSHDPLRICPGASLEAGDGSWFGCSYDAPAYPAQAFVTLPTDCSAGALPTSLHATSWLRPQEVRSASFVTDRNDNPTAVTGCEDLRFTPTASILATTDQVETSSGLDVSVAVPVNGGLLEPGGLTQAQVKKITVTLPSGMTVNSSAAEGLGACTPQQYAAETAVSAPGTGCPNNSKLGTVQIDTPLLEEPIEGAFYLAQQDDPGTFALGAENPFDSLLALYIVAKDPDRGLIIKMAGKVEPDEKTGQLVSTFDDLPQLPFREVELHFREGVRAPLVSPPTCGTYTTEADFVPWSATDPDNPSPDEVVHTTSKFQVTRGVGGGPCPSGGLPPFKPGLIAGTLNNAAGSYSPFNLRLTRNDGEQEFTHFSIKLPPGVTGKLAGVPFCPDGAITAAKLRRGADELANPSCPKASEVGRTLVGAGVGSVLTYVPGKVYLAGPYNGSALSIVAITAAKVGPFDVGTVVIRQALKINPETAEVFIDATGSDPIPHIIKGITVHARDIRVYVDKPDFVLNPTSCKRTSTASTVLGSGLDFASAADDNPLTVTSPFQAADCAALGFKPKLQLSLKGGTKRGDNPALRAVLRPRAGDANSARVSVQLPHSEFLDQSHIRTICTRVQFNAGAGNGAGCPAGSVYGHARAFTPLLDQPLEGPVFLRSSDHPLPDLVLALNGLIDFNAVGRIDSVDGGIRNSFDFVPDAPITKVVLTMQGGKKGLLVNSTNLCKAKHRAVAKFTGQNGVFHSLNPVLKAKCPKAKKPKRRARGAG